MLSRRVLLAAPLAAAPFSALAKRVTHGGFPSFVASVQDEAVRAGLDRLIIEAAFQGVVPNPKILELDRHQPEFTLTWAQYRAKVIPESRVAAGQQAYGQEAGLLMAVGNRYGVDPRVIVGIWGLESGYGARTGGFGVVEALATLAYDGRRASYFRSELLNALRILNARDVTPQGMTGSWAGAMGQPQFMPSSYLRYAVDWDGDGRRDIWRSRADVFASVANYLARCGWRAGEPWGQPVMVPPGYTGPEGREIVRTLGAWEAAGVRRINGTRFSRQDVPGALVMPDGPGGEAFLVYANFNVIRRYNPSDFYALAVGLLGNAVA